MQQAGCFVSMCVTPIAFSTCPLLEARKSRPHDVDRPEDISMKYVADFLERDTKGHVVEKAVGVTHIEMKHPACCTVAQKSFL